MKYTNWWFCLIVFLFITTQVKSQRLTDSLRVVSYQEEALALLESGNDQPAMVLADSAGIFLQKHALWEESIQWRLSFARALTAGGKVDHSLSFLQKALQVASNQFGPQHEFIADLYYELARASFFDHAFENCIAYSVQSLALRKAQIESNHYIISAHHNYIGMSNLRLGNYQAALDFLEKALNSRIAAVGIEDPRVANIHNNLGELYSQMGNLKEAEVCYTKALNIRQNIFGAQHPRMISIYKNLANVYEEKGYFTEAIDLYSRALMIVEEHEISGEILADLYNNLGVAHNNQGVYDESLSYLKKARSIYSGLEGDFLEKIANTYTNQAIIHFKREEYDSTITYHKRALTANLMALGEKSPEVADNYTNLGLAYFEKGDYAKSLEFHQKAFQILSDQPGGQAAFADVCNNIADTHFELGDDKAALQYNQQALNIQMNLYGSKHPLLSYTYNSLARIFRSQGNYPTALESVQQALIANHPSFTETDWKITPRPEGYYRYAYFLESLLLKAELLRSRQGEAVEHLTLAGEIYQRADELLTDLRDQLVSGEDKITQARNVHRLSRAAVSNSLALAGKTGNRILLDDAFYFSERSKANVLLSSIAANEAMYAAGIPDSVILREERLQGDIRYNKEQLAAQLADSLTTHFQNELFTSQQAYRKHQESLKHDYPLYYQLKHEDQRLEIPTVQAALEPSTAVISYFTAGDNMYIFRIEKKDFEIYEISLDEGYYNDLLDLRIILSSRERSDYDDELYLQLANNLYEKLFPFRIDDGVEKIILVPDGPLVGLPFEILLTEPVETGNAPNFSNLPYLIERFEISYAPSVTLYFKRQQNQSAPKPKNANGLLAFAPVFADEPAVSTFGEEAQDLLERNRTNDRGVIINGAYLSALPETVREIEAIEQIFRSAGQESAVYLYGNATEAALRQSRIGSARYLHLATHGFVDESQPDLSGVFFYPDSTNTKDGILSAWEVYGLQLNAELVVLSACETGLGKETRGEGLLGLSRAFLYAGAENLLVSLWKVSDSATAELMTAFYQEHLAHPDLSFAHDLREAKRALIRSDQFQHPYYWSPFVLVGN